MGLDKLYPIVKNHFPAVMRRKYQNGRKQSFLFITHVAKENDGVNYLLVVVDVLSKYVRVRPMKNKTARSVLEAFDSILSEGIKPEKLRTYEGTEFLNESFQLYLNNKKKHSISC